MMPGPTVSLREPHDRDEVLAAVERAVASSVPGRLVAEVEATIADLCGTGHAIAVSSGSEALLVALTALGLGAGDEVVTSPFAEFDAVEAILRVGATPVFADIDPESYTLSPEAVERVVTEQTRVVLPVHRFGRCADMLPMLSTAIRHGLAVVEDVSPSIGAEYRGRRAGSLGTLGCLSFDRDLPGEFGPAGAVVTNDAGLADRVRLLRQHGERPRHLHTVVGGEFRLDDVRAAVLGAHLAHHEARVRARRAVARGYDADLAALGLARSIQTPTETPGRHVYDEYVVRSERRDELRTYLAEQGIETAVPTPLPVHVQPCVADAGPVEVYPYAERAAEETLSLPVHRLLTDDDRRRVVATIGRFHGVRPAAIRRAA